MLGKKQRENDSDGFLTFGEEVRDGKYFSPGRAGPYGPRILRDGPEGCESRQNSVCYA